MNKSTFIDIEFIQILSLPKFPLNKLDTPSGQLQNSVMT